MRKRSFERNSTSVPVPWTPVGVFATVVRGGTTPPRTVEPASESTSGARDLVKTTRLSEGTVGTQELLRMCYGCIENHIQTLPFSQQLSLRSLIEEYARLRVDASKEESDE